MTEFSHVSLFDLQNVVSIGAVIPSRPLLCNRVGLALWVAYCCTVGGGDTHFGDGGNADERCAREGMSKRENEFGPLENADSMKDGGSGDHELGQPRVPSGR